MTVTSEERYVEAQLSIINGALKRALEALNNLDNTSRNAAIAQTHYAGKWREIKSAKARVEEAIKTMGGIH